MLAALGRGQLDALDDMIARRREIRRGYVDGAGGHRGRALPGRGKADDAADNCWLTGIVHGPRRRPHGERGDALIKALGEEDIEARQLWKPMHVPACIRAGFAALLRAHRSQSSRLELTLSGPDHVLLATTEVERVES